MLIKKKKKILNIQWYDQAMYNDRKCNLKRKCNLYPAFNVEAYVLIELA